MLALYTWNIYYLVNILEKKIIKRKNKNITFTINFYKFKL